MSNLKNKKLHGPRTIAPFVGPYGSGKTSLLESIAHLDRGRSSARAWSRRGHRWATVPPRRGRGR